MPEQIEIEEKNTGPEYAGQAWEAACVRRSLAGDQSAYTALVSRYAPRLCTYLYRFAGSREDAEDLAQETFLRAFQALPQFDLERPFRNWLYTIANNLARNALRAKGRRGTALSLDEEWDAGGKVEAAGTSAVERVAGMELAEQLSNAVQRLPGASAALIHLHYHEGISIREAAKVLGMKENAARVRLHRARRALREWLMDEEKP